MVLDGDGGPGSCAAGPESFRDFALRESAGLNLFYGEREALLKREGLWRPGKGPVPGAGRWEIPYIELVKLARLGFEAWVATKPLPAIPVQLRAEERVWKPVPHRETKRARRERRKAEWQAECDRRKREVVNAWMSGADQKLREFLEEFAEFNLPY